MTLLVIGNTRSGHGPAGVWRGPQAKGVSMPVRWSNVRIFLKVLQVFG